MAFETKDNSGALFRNKRKETENHPDSTGTVKIEGVEFYINGWTKTTKDGDKFVSLSFKRKEPKADPSREAGKLPTAKQERSGHKGFNDFDAGEVPF